MKLKTHNKKEKSEQNKELTAKEKSGIKQTSHCNMMRNKRPSPLPCFYFTCEF